EPGMRVMIENLDAGDLRQQPLVDHLRFRRDQRARLRLRERRGKAERGQQGECRDRVPHLASVCGFGSGFRGSIASRIAAWYAKLARIADACFRSSGTASS